LSAICSSFETTPSDLSSSLGSLPEIISLLPLLIALTVVINGRKRPSCNEPRCRVPVWDTKLSLVSGERRWLICILSISRQGELYHVYCRISCSCIILAQENTLRAERAQHTMSVSRQTHTENEFVTGIFGNNGSEVTGIYSELHYEKLHN
jgi:hypothetical protein